MNELQKSVLFVSSSYPQNSKDWKSVFIQQLLTALVEQADTKVSYWGPPGSLPEGTSFLCTAAETKWLENLMEQGGIIHLIRQGGINSVAAPFRLLSFLKNVYGRTPEIDIIHVNWLQNALPLLGKGPPAVISVLGSDLGMLKIPGMTYLLKRLFKRRNCVLAPNADWMVPVLQQKFAGSCKVNLIPLGINDHWYNIKRDFSSQKVKKWLVISRITEAKMGPLFSWGESFFAENEQHQLHLFGPMQEELEVPDWVRYHGSTYPEELKENWFPQAAGLITLSQHDEGRPQVMLEAMASGVPIIASDIVAHKNFIEHLHTGYLVSSRKEFFKALEWLSLNDNNVSLSTSAKQWVSEEVGNWSKCAQRYTKLYSQLLRENG